MAHTCPLELGRRGGLTEFAGCAGSVPRCVTTRVQLQSLGARADPDKVSDDTDRLTALEQVLAAAPKVRSGLSEYRAGGYSSTAR